MSLQVRFSYVIARSGSKRRGNLLTVLHLDVADLLPTCMVGHRPCFATSCKLICYENHRWLTMHRNDSLATIASLPVRPNHVISWIFPSCNCKSVPIMSLLDILLCLLTSMFHMSLRVSFTMSLQVRFPYVIARSGQKRRGNLLPVLHLDVAEHASRKQVGHLPCLQPLVS